MHIKIFKQFERVGRETDWITSFVVLHRSVCHGSLIGDIFRTVQFFTTEHDYG